MLGKSVASQLKPLFFSCTVGAGSYASFWYFTRVIDNRHLAVERWKKDKSVFNKISRWWRNVPFHDKFFYSVVTINTCIWISWKSKRLQPFLLRHFITSPSRTSSTPSLLLSSFSHLEVWHIAINMTVLWSFVPSFISIVGKEWTWPFYLTAGTFASMCGHYYKVFKGITAVPSLGASGALLAVATLVIMNNPDSTLYIIFLPFIPIPAYLGLCGIVCFDMIGLVRGWKLFDHAAHLGGVLFAGLYQLITRTS